MLDLEGTIAELLEHIVEHDSLELAESRYLEAADETKAKLVAFNRRAFEVEHFPALFILVQLFE